MPRPKVDRLEIRIPREAKERLGYLTKLLGGLTPSETLGRALRLFDRVVCSVVVEGAELVIVHRNKRTEHISKRDV